MTEEQYNQLIEMLKTQNDMIGRMGIILVRITWLLITATVVLCLIFGWLFLFIFLLFVGPWLFN
jgi:hypothetical protein